MINDMHCIAGGVTLVSNFTILDVSGNGACVLVPDAAKISAVFLLWVEGTKTTYSCVVRWRTRNRIGVAFVTQQA